MMILMMMMMMMMLTVTRVRYAWHVVSLLLCSVLVHALAVAAAVCLGRVKGEYCRVAGAGAGAGRGKET